MDREGWTKILEAVEELSEIHEKGVSDPTRCREFNTRAAVLLDRLEEQGATAAADRMMDILGGCSPKDFSPCDNRQLTKGALERLRDWVRENAEKS
ncbi:MAG: hypothetical protein A4E48_02181 [Methanosaeta sp. PtaU1.Bin060]|jgi:hypothetical protein|nr:MAG: hypothetical protein A4E48_02181 [Methanosaeta sp. PtaU1.Bin060]